MMKVKCIFAGVLLLLSTVVGPAFAGFSSIVSFGDSLSDNGQLTLQGEKIAWDNHGFYRYTDSGEPVWVEILADYYGAQLYDFAYGGATTGMDNYRVDLVGTGWSGLTWQVGQSDIQDMVFGDSTTPGLAMADTLFTVWAGGNDFLAGGDAETAVDQLISNLDVLKGLGAQNILVPNLPDIGKTPSFYGTLAAGAASDFTEEFNLKLAQGLQSFANHFSGTVYTMDVYGIFNGVIPESYLWSMMFWDVDGFHPSALGHETIAYAAERAQIIDPIPSSVPVPSAVILMVSGLVGLTGLRRRRIA